MKKVKKQIARNLFDALYEANMADVNISEDAYGMMNSNDLDASMSRQNSLYGTLSIALKQLGFKKELAEFIETGDRPTI